MTDQEKRIMRLLDEQDFLYAGLIREATGLSRSQVWRIMTGLQSKGMVRQSVGRRGRSMYALTVQGLRALDEIE